MNAITYSKYGDPNELRRTELDKPVPGANEILIHVRATSVSAADSRTRSFNVPAWQWIFARIYLGVLGPKRKVLGMEISGVVEEVGSMISRFKVGDEVFASTLFDGFGGYAEYICLPESAPIALKPSHIDFTSAASIPIGAGTALRFLKKAGVKPGDKLLVYGASGSVGTYAVQLGRVLGAEVDAVCSERNQALVKTLGARRVFDYAQDYSPAANIPYDIVFDAVGKMKRSKGKALLKKGGKYISVLGNPGKIQSSDLAFIAQQVSEGRVHPVVDKVFSINDIIKAHQYVDTGKKRGNVPVVIDFNSTAK